MQLEEVKEIFPFLLTFTRFTWHVRFTRFGDIRTTTPLVHTKAFALPLEAYCVKQLPNQLNFSLSAVSHPFLLLFRY